MEVKSQSVEGRNMTNASTDQLSWFLLKCFRGLLENDSFWDSCASKIHGFITTSITSWPDIGLLPLGNHPLDMFSTLDRLPRMHRSQTDTPGKWDPPNGLESPRPAHTLSIFDLVRVAGPRPPCEKYPEASCYHGPHTSSVLYVDAHR